MWALGEQRVRLSLSQIMWLLFFAMFIPLFILIVNVERATSRSLEQARQVRDDDVPGAILYLQILDEIGDLHSNVLDYLAGEEDELADFEANLDEFKVFLASLKPLETRPVELSQLTQVEALVQEYETRSRAEVFNLYSPDTERSAARRADRLENIAGKILREELWAISEQTYQQLVEESRTGKVSRSTLSLFNQYRQLSNIAPEMINSVSEYVFGEPEEEQIFYEMSERFGQMLTSVSSLEHSVDEQIALDRIAQLHATIQTTAEDIFSVYASVAKLSALKSADELEHIIMARTEALLDNATAEETQEAAHELDLLAKSIVSFRNWFRLAAIVLTLGFGMFFVFISRQVSGSFREAVDVANTIASGRSSETATITEGPREVIELHSALASMSQRIQEQREAVQSASQARSANLAKSQFLRSMSHEIRTPLNSILGFTDVLFRDQSLSDENKAHVDRIKRSGRHLLALINDVLDMSKIESGHLEVENASVPIEELTSDLKSIMGFRADEKGLSFEVKIQPDVPDFINTDYGKLRQILINLLGNAVKFTQSGEVSITVGTQTKRSGYQEIAFDVKDTGSGVPQEDQERIFNTFEQAKGRHHAEGSGLGLAISKEYALLMNGDLYLVGSSEAGSHFRLVLPLIVGVGRPPTESLAAPQTISELPEGASAPKILIVDDVTSNRDLITSLLSNKPYQLIEAVDGLDAIGKYKDQKPDIVLMDVRMPEMDGFEATQKILSSAGGRNARIIAVTANAFDEDKERALSVGMVDFLRKPLDEAALLAAIDRNLTSPEERTVNWSTIDEGRLASLANALETLSIARLEEDLRRLTDIDPALISMIRRRAANFEHEQMLQEIGEIIHARS